MPSFSVRDVLVATKPQAAKATPAITSFTDVVTDTRKIQPGVLFIALKGERFNGEDFAAEAVAKGAKGVIVSEACPEEKYASVENADVFRVPDTLKAYQQLAHYWRMKFHLPVIAITGSNGKTTTKDLTAAVLSARGPVLKTQANFNNEIGLPLTLLGVNKEHKAAVVEIGMNADNKYVAGMRGKAGEDVRVITFGLEQPADVKGGDIRTAGTQTTFAVTYAGETHDYTIAMVGRHNVYNALAAIACGFALKLTPEEIQRGLQKLEATKMRFELQKVKDWQVVNDAYNASPMSMTAAISTLSELVKGRKIAVMGDMLELGSVSEKAHYHVGEELAEKKFAAVVTLGEMGRLIAQGAREHGVAAVYSCDSHEAAAGQLHAILKPGDTLLFKGSRGMQMEKIIGLL